MSIYLNLKHIAKYTFVLYTFSTHFHIIYEIWTVLLNSWPCYIPDTWVQVLVKKEWSFKFFEVV